MIPVVGGVIFAFIGWVTAFPFKLGNSIHTSYFSVIPRLILSIVYAAVSKVCLLASKRAIMFKQAKTQKRVSAARKSQQSNGSQQSSGSSAFGERTTHLAGQL